MDYSHWMGRISLALMLLRVIAGSDVFAAETEARNAAPHIVLFLSDDHTATDSSVYGDGTIATPAMERIASAGMLFEQAFVASPSCAPSRASLLTGLMPARHGAEANRARPGAAIKKLPAYLQELGYEVVSFGKVGHYVQTPEYGFDVARHFHYHEDVAVPNAVAWLRERNQEKPLCLIVGTNWPHVPWPDVENDSASAVPIPPNHVDTPATRRARARYAAAVKIMDTELWQVHDAAYEVLGENTLFIHTSDHGAQWPFGKWTLYDDGIHTPLIATWPGRIQEGACSDALVSWVDLLPTLVEAAGGEVPTNLDGRSFLPVLLGEREEHRDQIFTTHSGDGNFNVYPIRSLRDKQWKYIRNLYPEFQFSSHVTQAIDDKNRYWPSWLERSGSHPEAAARTRAYQQRPPEELYDLRADPHELKNLAGQEEHAERLAAMRVSLDSWMDEQGDQQRVFGVPKLTPGSQGSPNVIVVLIDDMGWSDLGCFGGEIATPHIDRLAREGRKFTHYYANSPICSPSRAALTVGEYPARHRITSYLAARAENERRGMDQWLDPKAPILARALQQGGYATGHFGKWHLGGQRDIGEAPLITEYGFDVSLTNFEGLGPRVLPLLDAHDGRPAEKYHLGSADLGRGEITWRDRSEVTDAFVAGAIQMIQNREGDAPFYLNVWPDDVHTPLFPSGRRRDDLSKRELYERVLQDMDAALGRLFDFIRNDAKLRDNTLILFMSDNGPERGAGRSRPLRGFKGQLYEGGIRSPLIVWGPGLLRESAAGSTNTTTIVTAIDLVESLYTLTGVPRPHEYRGDGEDLLGVLLGYGDGQRSGSVMWRRPPDRPGPPDDPLPDLAIRDNQWKLLCDVDGSRAALYNLEKDAREQRNVAEQHPVITQRLTRRVLEWNAALPKDGVAQRTAED